MIYGIIDYDYNRCEPYVSSIFTEKPEKYDTDVLYACDKKGEISTQDCRKWFPWEGEFIEYDLFLVEGVPTYSENVDWDKYPNDDDPRVISIQCKNIYNNGILTKEYSDEHGNIINIKN
jgi:hypothetical protein